MSLILGLKNVLFDYSEKRNSEGNDFSLKDVSADIEEGSFTALIGKNGSGKSTLVKLVSRILTGYSGSIRYQDADIHSIDRKEFSRKISYLPQTAEEFSGDIVVEDFLMLGRYAHKQFTDFRFSQNDRDVVAGCIKEMSIEQLTKKKIAELSGGERQKVMITLSLVQLDITEKLEGKILIIDEPLTYLDVNHQFEIFGILKMLNKKGLTIIVVIHDLNFALKYSDKTMLMSGGKMIRYDKTEEVITEDILREHFLIESKIMNFEKNYFINYLPS